MAPFSKMAAARLENQLLKLFRPATGALHMFEVAMTASTLFQVRWKTPVKCCGVVRPGWKIPSDSVDSDIIKAFVET